MTHDLAQAEVDLAAVAHNVGVLAAHTPAAVMAVVKADAFGHGMLPVARAALAAGATWLGVATAAEALALRAAGVRAPVLSWLHSPRTDFAELVAADVDVSVPSVAHLDAVATGAHQAGRPAQVHLKIDTGMARNGADPAEWPQLVTRAAALERAGLVRVHGIWSHLYEADRPGSPGTTAQQDAFASALIRAMAAGLRPPLRHLANSAAVFSTPSTHYDLVRTGLALYGVEPVPGREHDLRPALTVTTEVAAVRRVPAGTGVSYHHAYKTARPTTLALLPLGFGDGLPRVTAGRAEVLLGGRRCRVVGRICMDQCVVDAGDLPVAAGDPVTVFGPGELGEPTVADWAGWAGTNPHEILTGLGGRIPRHHRSHDRTRQLTGRH
ncbi:alanine racemase [Catellatospora sp. KI3]|uniref:alanine racemase n=1 Tax=Catellatospora sp. KI3 TaxID=3041620 RepID=UPI002482F96B|nr:alanine racemase [Catellatospora sp. KI3]MDI1466198.1 alanine racemase [Catellatospora sp. KI3]